MDAPATSDPEKGSTEFLVLSLVAHEARHGYELSKLIESRSRGVVRPYVASLYPLLYRLEKQGLIHGRWVERGGERRRRFYRITAAGNAVLARQRRSWKEFVTAINRVTRAQDA